MDKVINSVFTLISKLKYVKKQKLVVDEDDIYIMKESYKQLKGIISFRLWKKIVIEYSISTCQDIYESCDVLVDSIIEKYKK